MKLPKARTENLLEQNLEKETLIYDLNIDKAFNLNETLSVVYRACGQNVTLDELKDSHKFTEDFIYLALDELKRNNLLKDEYASPFVSSTRREIIKKVGLATMFALPIITGLVAPRAVNAASGDSGGSSVQGNYDQACIPNPYVQNNYYCNGELRCVPTSRSTERCCVAASGSQVYFYPGESNTYTDYSPRYYAQGTSPVTPAEECASSISCCSGATPSGTCTYQPDTYNEYSDAELAEQARDNMYPYISTCTCSC